MVLNAAAYLFVTIEDPRALADRLRAQAGTLALRGTLLVAPEGLNLFVAGEDGSVHALLDAIRSDPRFAALQAKFSRSASVPFARLKVKVKREIIAFRDPGSSPLDRRAPSVAPETLAAWLDAGRDDEGRPIVLLDTRNREETAQGSFRGAVVLPIDNFTDFTASLDPDDPRWREATVVPFCTGGIRCEKAALWMGDHGFARVRQLEGGILGYFERVGGRHYDGACFVFDARIALDPALRPLREGA